MLFKRDKDFESMDTDHLFSELNDLFMDACMHDEMIFVEFIMWSYYSGFNHLIRVLRERLKHE